MQRSTLLIVNSRIKYFIYESLSNNVGEVNDKVTWKKIRRQVRYNLLKSMPYFRSKDIRIHCDKNLNTNDIINKHQCFCTVFIPRFNIDITIGIKPVNTMIQGKPV